MEHLLKKLQNLSLKLILCLVWFDLMCFTLILAGNIFKWSFFNESIGSAFFTTFGLSLGALAALAILHTVLTLNIISNSISAYTKHEEGLEGIQMQKAARRFKHLLCASITGILCIVVYQGVAEHNAVRHKVGKVEQELSEAAQTTIVSHILKLIQEDSPVNQLFFARDELLLSLPDNKSVSLLIPKMGQTGQIFYLVSPWDYDNKNEASISGSLQRPFLPNDNERTKFEQLLKNKTPFSVVDRYVIRAFYPVTVAGDIKVILLLDTSRSVSNEYIMSRGKY